MESLLDKALAFSNLCKAWQEVAENRGAAGVDEVSLRAWGRNWEERLRDLAQAVRANTYRPKKLRLRRIPKANRREVRNLRIPTVTDRVLQRAVLEVLYPVFEPRFLDCSFGYRPRRGLKQAVERILALREQGFLQVLDADIDDFFGQVDVELLLVFLTADLPDDSILPLMRAWVQNGLCDIDQGKGIPLGSPLSPLLANIYLHRLDLFIAHQGWSMVRYADDFLVFACSIIEIERVYHAVAEGLAALHLSYEPSKTRLTSFEQGFTFLGVCFEGEEYRYIFLEKEVRVRGDQVDTLFSHYGPDYD